MSELRFLPGVGRAAGCVVGRHRPKPLRYVLHHVQPKVCGGLTTPANTEQVCDSCHASVHVLLWHLAQGTPPPARGTRVQRKLARRGYQACVVAGTVDKIPNEG